MFFGKCNIKMYDSHFLTPCVFSNTEFKKTHKHVFPGGELGFAVHFWKIECLMLHLLVLQDRVYFLKGLSTNPQHWTSVGRL